MEEGQISFQLKNWKFKIEPKSIIMMCHLQTILLTIWVSSIFSTKRSLTFFLTRLLIFSMRTECSSLSSGKLDISILFFRFFISYWLGILLTTSWRTYSLTFSTIYTAVYFSSMEEVRAYSLVSISYLATFWSLLRCFFNSLNKTVRSFLSFCGLHFNKCFLLSVSTMSTFEGLRKMYVFL